jgi:hypothetical protein
MKVVTKQRSRMWFDKSEPLALAIATHKALAKFLRQRPQTFREQLPVDCYWADTICLTYLSDVALHPEPGQLEALQQRVRDKRAPERPYVCPWCNEDDPKAYVRGQYGNAVKHLVHKHLGMWQRLSADTQLAFARGSSATVDGDRWCELTGITAGASRAGAPTSAAPVPAAASTVVPSPSAPIAAAAVTSAAKGQAKGVLPALTKAPRRRRAPAAPKRPRQAGNAAAQYLEEQRRVSSDAGDSAGKEPPPAPVLPAPPVQMLPSPPPSLPRPATADPRGATVLPATHAADAEVVRAAPPTAPEVVLPAASAALCDLPKKPAIPKAKVCLYELTSFIPSQAALAHPRLLTAVTAAAARAAFGPGKRRRGSSPPPRRWQPSSDKRFCPGRGATVPESDS